MSKQSDLDNHANQLNPNNDEYWHSRGLDMDDEREYNRACRDNRANQLNPNNECYWNSRNNR